MNWNWVLIGAGVVVVIFLFVFFSLLLPKSSLFQHRGRNIGSIVGVVMFTTLFIFSFWVFDPDNFVQNMKEWWQPAILLVISVFGFSSMVRYREVYNSWKYPTTVALSTGVVSGIFTIVTFIQKFF